MADIFLSYASQDRDIARQLAERLAEAGYSVWWDRTIPPGRVFDDVIQEALSAAKCVVVLWSRQSVRSNWVKVEAEEAAARNRLVPVMIEEVAPPIQFRRIQAANLTGWNGDGDHPELSSLRSSIDRLLAQPETAAAAPAPALGHASVSTRSTGRPRVLFIAGIAVLAIVAVSLYAVLSYRSGTGDGTSLTPTREQSATPSAAEAPDRSRGRNAGAGPPATAATTTTTLGDRINLVSRENGGELLAAADAQWAATVDGDERTSLSVAFYTGGKSEAVFGFKDGRPATFDAVEVLIPETSGNNVAEFELLTGNDGLDGRFESIQIFRTRNMLLLKERFQRFTFKPRTARFVKFKLLRAHAESTSPYLYEWRLLGIVN